MSRRAKVAYGGCAAMVGACAVGCAGIGGLVALGAFVATTQWENGARGVIEGQTGGEVTFDDLDVSWPQVAVDGLHVRGADGAEVVRVDRLVIGAGPRAFANDPVVASEITLTGVHVALERGADGGWRVPPTTAALLSSGSAYAWPELRAERVRIEDVTLVATTPDGSSTLTVAHIDASALSASLVGGLTWSVRDGSATGIAATRDGGKAPYGTIARVQAGRDGVLTVSGLTFAFDTALDRELDLPPALADAAPDWMGGHRSEPAADAAWLGLRLQRGWPWAADQLVVLDSTVTLTDDVYGPSPVPWVFGVSRATIGPLSDDGASLPIASEGTLAGGPLAIDAAMRREGAISGSVRLRGGDATAFEPYLRATFRKASLALTRGVVTARFDGSLDGSRLRATGAVSMLNLKFDSANQDDGGSAILGLASKLFTANEDEPYTVPLSFDGSLADPRFSPIERSVRAVEASAGNQAVGTARDVVSGIERTWKRVFGGD